MKKIIITASLVSLFVISTNTVFAQASESMKTEIEATISIATTKIKNNKTLTDSEKKNFIARIEAAAKTAKIKNDAEAKESFNQDYMRISKNYTAKTGQPLSDLENKAD